MLAKRIWVAVLLIPFGVGVILWGGIAYVIVVSLILGIAGWEFGRLFAMISEKPATGLIAAGCALLPFARAYLPPEIPIALFGLFILIAMTLHLLRYEAGDNRAATSFAITTCGLVYIGWIGSYLIPLRSLPNGVWWVLTILPIVWMADAGAMFTGMRFGKRMLSPRLSPKKTWEGYYGGVLSGILGGMLLAALWGRMAPEITLWKGALAGLILSGFTPLGDLGESMIKRQVGAKDSGTLLPGHGGLFDRIDSWLWAAVIGYYFVYFLG